MIYPKAYEVVGGIVYSFYVPAVENVPNIKYSDPGNQSGVSFPFITKDPVGASCTPLDATHDPTGGNPPSYSSFFAFKVSYSLEFSAKSKNDDRF
mmetsp:Transcript_30442/g.45050  ORF Transcript_30442/g.45050 Transcript_30442/m.45050 type:complete len:95 (+) Transcript_30442:163-447(+)|eukprot:CAMPEP_0194216348 /NCGR_PEP_ID=MMETSP0156-20130528/18823_1 /TAXON_ID=33649 /ORGANISM="Thalassionema nitzschioides, Strain L26-B" /LENGTH=94 /DNA_ID=CAMNT_0038945097 /DNA_START=81 /DNA_END=365 /DNA_ORIENTATION=-